MIHDTPCLFPLAAVLSSREIPFADGPAALRLASGVLVVLGVDR